MGNKFWGYEIDDQPNDSEYSSCVECTKAMDEDYAEQVQQDEGDLKNGDTRSTDARIIRFKYDNDNERKIIYTQDVIVEYQHYHGDRAEHGTY